MALRTGTKSAWSAALNQNAPIYDGTLDSLGYIKVNEVFDLWAQQNTFLRFLNNLPIVTMDRPNVAYAENIPAWMLTPAAYYRSGTVTSFDTGARLSEWTLTFTTTVAGSTYYTTKWQAGDVIVIHNENDASQMASLYLKSRSSNDWTCELLTDNPGFVPTTSSKVYNKGRLDAPGSDTPTAWVESDETCWFTSQEMRESVKLTLEDAGFKGLITGDPLDRAKAQAMRRIMKKIHDGLAYVNQRVSATAGQPWALPDKTLADTNSLTMWTSMSFLQACNAASFWGLGTRVKKLSKTLATDQDYQDAFSEVYKYQEEDGPNLVGMCSWNAYQSVINFVRANKLTYNIGPETKKYGLRIKTLELPWGLLDLTVNRGFDGGLADAMFVINPKAIRKGHYSSLFYRDLTASTSKSAILGEYYVHTGLMVAKPYSHQVVFFQ